MERIIQADIIPEDDKIEQGLRPSHLSEYIGQEKAKKNLRVFIEAAKKRAGRSGCNLKQSVRKRCFIY